MPNDHSTSVGFFSYKACLFINTDKFYGFLIFVLLCFFAQMYESSVNLKITLSIIHISNLFTDMKNRFRFYLGLKAHISLVP